MTIPSSFASNAPLFSTVSHASVNRPAAFLSPMISKAPAAVGFGSFSKTPHIIGRFAALSENQASGLRQALPNAGLLNRNAPSICESRVHSKTLARYCASSAEDAAYSGASSVDDKYFQLRGRFKEWGVTGVLVPRGDEYFGESVPACNERLAYLTGFTGSWGLALVQEDKAHLFVDSRYELQAPQEVDTNKIECVCVSDVPLITGLVSAIPAGGTVGYDPALHTVSEIQNYQQALAPHGITLKALSQNPVDDIRGAERPIFPDTPIIVYPENYAGQSVTEKLQVMNEKLACVDCDSAFVALPESVCWLMNIRANDVPHTPFVLSNALVSRSASGPAEVDLFIGKSRVSPALQAQLPGCVRVHDREDLDKVLKARGVQRVLLDPAHASQKTYSAFKNSGAKITFGEDPTLLAKAIKNPVEIAGTKRAHIRDGAAVTRFGAWLAKQVQNWSENTLTELECVDKIAEFRNETGKLRDLSFATIAGSGPNGAIVHYHATPNSNRALGKGELLLLDSGGQYFDGTTDITRTFAIGQPSAEMREHYTRVLKGHIDLAMAEFPRGTTGADLDPLARAPLREKSLDYGHGTGHGVGMYLGVHEGPQGISAKSKVPLEAGMVLSNEPGYYKTGEYGIRLENLVVVSAVKPESVRCGLDRNPAKLKFETISLAPFDRNLIDPTLLSQSERQWLNAYHQQVQSTLMPLMTNNDERRYLAAACAPINNKK